MAKFKGTHLDQVQPMLREEYEAVDEMTAEKWWDALSDGVRKDEDLQIDLREGRNLYYYTDEGTLVRAVEEGKSIQSYGVHMNLLQKSLNGRLFTRSADGKTLRQVVTNPMRGFEVGVSNESDEWQLPNPEPVKPSAPSFWKYLLYPFSSSIREEFRIYKEESEEYPDRLKQFQWIKGFGPEADKNNLLSEDFEESKRLAEELERKREELEREREELERKKRVEIEKENYRKAHNERKERWDKDVTKMTLEEFREYRENLYSTWSDYRGIIMNKHATVDDIYDLITRDVEVLMLMEQDMDPKEHMAGRSKLMSSLTVSLESGGYYSLFKEFITVQQEPWQKAKELIKEEVRKQFPENIAKDVLKTHDWNSREKERMDQEIRKVYKNLRNQFREIGVIFDTTQITPEVANKMMVTKYRNEGPEAVKIFVNKVNPQSVQKDAPQTQQPKKEQTKTGPTM